MTAKAWLSLLRRTGALALVLSAFAVEAQTAPPPGAGACRDCGVVQSVRHVETRGEASGVGAVAGGVLGGVLGHQIGSGRGNTVATIAGAGAGAYAGHQIEKNRNKTVTYQVVVKMEDGKTRYFDYKEPTSFRMGDKVRIVDHKLAHR